MYSGIYKITCLANNKCYIGQSARLGERKREHWEKLRLGTHRNHYLQNDWNMYGALNFKFEILERCEEKDLNERECYWIAHFKSTEREFGYNIQAGGSHKNKGLVAKPRYSNTTKYKR